MGSITVPRVSIVLVTYNHEPYFGQALDSALSQQTDFPFEIIVSEDCSTDRTGELVEAAAERDPEVIRIVRSPANLCTNEVTSRALDMAQGEYVAFLDGDDYWTAPDKLQRQVSFLDAHPDFSICFHDVLVVGPDGQVVGDTYNRARPTPAVGGYDDIVWFNYIAGPSPMIRRSAISQLPAWFEEAEFGDWPLYILAAEHGSIGFLPEVLGAYRVHSGGYWNSMGEEQRRRDCVRFLQRVWQDAPPSRRAVLDRSLRVLTLELLDWQLRERGWASAARALGSTVLDGLRQRNTGFVLSTVAKASAALPGRMFGRGR